LARNRSLATAAAGSAFFWSLASLAQLNVDSYGILELGLEQHEIGPLLAVMALGVGFGSLLAGWLSAGKIEFGIVPCGATGIALGALGLAATSNSYAATLIGLFCMGAGAGMFDVPLQTFLQARSPITSRGAVLAATNFLTFSGSLACAGLFWLLREPLGCSPRQIFLLSGLTVLPVIGLALKVVPAQALKLAVSLATRLLYRVRVIDPQHVPANEGALLVANHVSWVDAVLICLNSERPIRMIGYADYFQSWPWNWIARQVGVIPIKPGAGRRSILESLGTARAAVAAGVLVCIFAEGAITRDGQIGPFKPGLLAIVRGTGAKVIPVYLDGLWGSIFSYRGGTSFLKWPRRWPLPVAIHYGQPLATPLNVDEVREAVIRLSGEANIELGDVGSVAVPASMPTLPFVFSPNRIAALAPSEV
jgi:acyl-[acyl-carrier-protein]-phospholipid O-acyltransferase/long-chain-fatty-acid--[acyl-carrier-protein] ligase